MRLYDDISAYIIIIKTGLIATDRLESSFSYDLINLRKRI